VDRASIILTDSKLQATRRMLRRINEMARGGDPAMKAAAR